MSNSVVRSILHGCSQLQELILNRCHRITDSAFDSLSSPFELLHGCLSLETISLQVSLLLLFLPHSHQGCNQITGYLASVFLKQCHNLRNLNLSQVNLSSVLSSSNFLLISFPSLPIFRSVNVSPHQISNISFVTLD